MAKMTPEQLQKIYGDGTYDKWLDEGKITPEKYMAGLNRLKELEAASGKKMIDEESYTRSLEKARAFSLGVSARDTITDDEVAPPAPQPKEEEVPVIRLEPEPPPPAPKPLPSAYVVGFGEARREDYSKLDEYKSTVPQQFRDFVLMPSRGPVWFEPSDEEVAKALRQQATEMPSEDGVSHPNYNAPRFADVGDRAADYASRAEEYRNQKWLEDLEYAKSRGESIYRARDIDETAPRFMRAARTYAEDMGPLEVLARGADRAITLGVGSNLVDTGRMTSESGDFANAARRAEVEANAGIHQAFSGMGMAPPWEAPSYEEEVSGETRNVEQGRKLVERHPVAYAAGNLAGSLAPFGATGRAARVAEGVFGVSGAKSALGGFARTGAAAGAGDFVAELGAQNFDNASREAMGEERVGPLEQLVAAGKQAGMSAVVGGVLGIPAGVSRGMRQAGDLDASSLAALEEAGGGTTMGSMSGLKPPPGHEALAREFPLEGSYAGARSRSANAMADDMMRQVGGAEGAVDAMSGIHHGEVLDELSDLNSRVRSIADSAVSRGEALAQAADDKALIVAKKFMDKADKVIKEGKLRRQEENAVALNQEGAPPLAPLPGPENHISDIEEGLRRADELDYGLETSYPSVSTDEIIRENFDIIRKLSFADDTNIPNTTIQKFRKAVNSLFRKKVVSAEEAELYKDVAYDMKQVSGDDVATIPGGGGDTIGGDKVEILLPRRVSARELDNLIQVFDEMGKFPNSPAPEAARFRQLGAVASDLRDKTFPILAGLKKRQHMELLENERMFRSMGLARNTDEVNAMDVDQVAAVTANLKNYAATPDSMIPKELAVARREFEKWLANHDEVLYDEYSHLRDLYRQKNVVNDFNIAANAAPRSKSAAFQTIENMVKGNDRDFEAVAEAMGSLAPQMRAARAESKRMRDVFSILGVDTTHMGVDEAAKTRIKIHQILVDGGDEYERLLKVAKPEQRFGLQVARKAAEDVDSMFKTLGFSPDKKRPRWSVAERRQVVEGLSNILDSYKSHGSKPEFNRDVDRIFAQNTTVKKALTDMIGERAFQYLRRQSREGVHAHASTASVNWYVSANDFFRNHIDALMGYKQKGLYSKSAAGTPVEPYMRSPFGAPVEYAQAATEPTDRNSVGDPRKISATQALKALIEVANKLEAEKNK